MIIPEISLPQREDIEVGNNTIMAINVLASDLTVVIVPLTLTANLNTGVESAGMEPSTAGS